MVRSIGGPLYIFDSGKIVATFPRIEYANPCDTRIELKMLSHPTSVRYAETVPCTEGSTTIDRWLKVENVWINCGKGASSTFRFILLPVYSFSKTSFTLRCGSGSSAKTV